MSKELMERFKKSWLNYNERNSYIKLIVCSILGYDENHMYNQLMGDLYENYLKVNDDVLPLVIEEFFITPSIENRLNQIDELERIKLAKEILERYIKPITILVNNEKYELAAMMFAYMNKFVRNSLKYYNELSIDEQTILIQNQNIYVKKYVI